MNPDRETGSHRPRTERADTEGLGESQMEPPGDLSQAPHLGPEVTAGRAHLVGWRAVPVLGAPEEVAQGRQGQRAAFDGSGDVLADEGEVPPCPLPACNRA